MAEPICVALVAITPFEDLLVKTPPTCPSFTYPTTFAVVLFSSTAASKFYKALFSLLRSCK